MTLTDSYTTTARRAESVLTDALDSWKNGLNALAAPLQSIPGNVNLGNIPRFDAADAVELQFKVVKRVVDVNYGYARQLAEASNTVSGAVRQHLEGLNSVVLEQLQSVSRATQSAVDTLEETVRDTADDAVRMQRDARQAAEKAERRKAARDAAREQYGSLNKSELSDEAAKRGLSKTGTVDELIERLVADDISE